MLLSVRNLSKSHGVVTVLQNVSFVVNAQERIGIVGSNGVGKTTLLKVLIGQEDHDSGTINYGTSVEFGYLSQTTPDFYGRTIEDLIMESVGNLRQLEERMHQLEAALANADEATLPTLLEEYTLVVTRFQDRGGYELDYKIDSILAGLHIDYLPRTQEMQKLSGGEKARVGLATLLLRSPELLLLDEPTNHLDFASMEWLESYLASYNGASLIVSHDRQFLNRAINQIFEIDEYEHHLKRYEGNYDAFVATKAAERAKWEADYERQQEEMQELRKRIKVTGRQIGHTNRAPRDNDKFARYFFGQNVDAAVSRNIKAAEEQLRRIEADPIPPPPALLQVNSHFSGTGIASQMVLNIADLSKSWDGRIVLDHINMVLPAQARIILIGPNGAGKTTLFRTIMGLEQPDSGEVHVVGSARIGYLPQEPALLDRDTTVIERYRYGQVGYEGEFIGRLLGYGFFKLEDMHKKVGQLSVGQQRKLEIACLMAAQPNVLLLDEPTNYISLDVLEAFEAAVLAFPGPVIAISHDRWFIQRFGGEQWTLEDGHLHRMESQGTNLLH